MFLLLRYQKAAFFFLLSIAIMGPLLGPGQILTLDSPLALNFEIAEYFSWNNRGAESVFAATYNSAPLAAILHGLDWFLPFQVIEKAWLVLILWLCGAGASRLPHLTGVGSYYAGFFYVVNPFTYIRLVSGQWGVLGAYALMPFAISAFVELLENSKPRQAVILALLLTAIGMLQTHGAALIFLVLACLYLARCFSTTGAFRGSLPGLIWTAALYLVLNSFWIGRFIAAGGGVIQDMPVGELEYFAASPALDVLSLRGSWLSDAFVDISDLVPVWWLLFLPLLFLAVSGAVSMRDNLGLRWLVLGVSLAGATGFVLAAGPGISGLDAFFTWLWERLPLYRGFRDTHKFAALLALAFAYLGALGLQALSVRFPVPRWRIKWFSYGVAGLFFGLTAVYSMPIFGVWGQVKPVDYPDGWQTVASILDDDPNDFRVLVLPWHMYIEFPWLPNRNKNLANPAPRFFSQPVISGDNIEITANYSDSSDPDSRYVEGLLRKRDEINDFGSLIAPLRAKYVVLFKTADYEMYGFLNDQTDLEMVFEGESIVLHRYAQ